MQNRPKIKLKLNSSDIVFEILGWLFLFIMIGLVIYSFNSLPDTIPTHFNASGNVDSYGSKNTFLLLPILGSILYIGLTILNRYPHVFNYLHEITEENALRQYTIATKMIRYLKFVIMLIFTVLTYAIHQNAENQSDGLGIWFLPLILAVIFLPTAYFIVKSIKNR